MVIHKTAFGELSNLSLEDLKNDLQSQRTMVRKLRIGIDLKKEKDSAKYRREKKTLSRMLTLLAVKTKESAAKTGEQLKKPTKTTKVSAPSKK